MQASNGAAYALGMLLGGQLVARHIRLPYAASATLLGLLVPLVFLFFRRKAWPKRPPL
jgi:predicted MFS family arabinose efflux permease